MHRRSFVATLASSSLLAALPPSLLAHGPLDLHAERRYRPVFASKHAFVSIQVEAYLAWSEKRAHRIWGTEAHDPFDGLIGEFYVTAARQVEIPEGIPGSVWTYETVVGVAAVEGVVHVGGFRRGAFTWIARVSGGPVAYVLDVMDAVMAMALPDEMDVRRDPALLEELLPGPGAFPVKVEVEEGS